ncbi:MAG: trifunctional transcriptional regulator/proline dehydrogenase/L-glutamate gamma-semialdehyde dehydrogenase, partial [Limnohabitans sp.]
SLQACGAAALPRVSAPLQALHDWAVAQGRLPLAHQCARLAACSPAGLQVVLPGPVGEHNVYGVRARQRVWCQVGAQAGALDDLLTQIAAVLAVGGQALLPERFAALHVQLPAAVQAVVGLRSGHNALQPDAVLIHAEAWEVQAMAQQLAAQDGPIIGLTA